ncbi:hypothetical protein N9174_01640 [bacterium]|nr:hypothetical protein [bacterium]
MENKEIWGVEEKLAENGFLSNLPEEDGDFLDESFGEDIIPIPQKKKKSRQKDQGRLCRKCRKPIDNANYFFCSVCHHTLDDVESHYAYNL